MSSAEPMVVSREVHVPGDDGQRGTRRRAVVAWTASIVIVGAIAGGLAGWNAWAASIRADIDVLIDAKAFNCAGAGDATTQDVGLGSEADAVINVPALRLSPELDCRFEFVVRNSGTRPVLLNAVSLPFMGPGNGTGVQAMTLDSFLVDRQEDGGVDARFELSDGGSTVLDAGEAMRISAMLGWRNGCMMDGGAVTLQDAALLNVSALGLPGDVSHRGISYSLLGTAESTSAGCGS